MTRSRSWKRGFRSLAVTAHGCTVARLPKYYLRFWVALAGGATAFVLLSPNGGALIRIGVAILLALCAFTLEGEARVGIEFTERGVLAELVAAADGRVVPVQAIRGPNPEARLSGRTPDDNRRTLDPLLGTHAIPSTVGRGEPAIERAVEALNDVAAERRANQNDRFEPT
jgi:hypothetical protein